MDVKYDRVSNCYRTEIRVKVGDDWRYLQPVIDTGATNTTVAFDALVDKDSSNDNLEKLWNKLSGYAKEVGVNRVIIHSAAKESDTAEIYAYDVCLENVIIGGHLMKKFHARIMMNGAKGICVIGNDFLNMCRYYHNAGEYQLTVENPVEQKYYESFAERKVLSNDQLNTLLSESESDTDYQPISGELHQVTTF